MQCVINRPEPSSLLWWFLFVWDHLILSTLIILVAPCLFGSPLILSPRVLSCGRASRLSCCALAPQGDQCWGNIPPDWYKTQHYRPWAVCVLYMCTSVLLVLWSSGQIKPPGEGGGGALEGSERGDWHKRRLMWANPVISAAALVWHPSYLCTTSRKEESDLHTKYSFGVWSRVW